MAIRDVLIEDHEVVPQLDQMYLNREALVDVLRVAAGERAFCTSNDVRGFDLITMHDKVVRGLRDAFCGAIWERDDQDQQEGIRNSLAKFRVIACNFDHNAGNPLVNPTNLVPKGSASNKKARCNATAWLPGLPDIPAQDGEELLTWVLGSHVDEDDVLRAELSLPLSFANRQYGRFQTRIILLSGNEGIGPLPARRPIDREGPVEIVDIAVLRK